MKIVVGVDGSEASRAALRFALDEAAATGADLVALGSWEPPVAPVAGALAVAYTPPADPTEAMSPWMTEAIDAVRREGDPPVAIEVRTGPPSGVLLEAAGDADHLVLGTRGQGKLASAFLGSVSHQVANHAPCPLTVVPADGGEVNVGGPVVVGVDGSENAAAALRWAAQRARREGVGLRAVSAWHDQRTNWVPDTQVDDLNAAVTEMERHADEVLKTAVAASGLPEGVEVERVVAEGPAARVVREAATDASMVVLGARGRGGFLGLLLGSAVSRYLNHVDRPVTVIPAVAGSSSDSAGAGS
ncbi:MAG: universal stress protein [Microthrixaceae bacterium]